MCIRDRTEGRHLLSDFIIRYLFEKTGQSSELEQSGNILVEFSMLELKVEVLRFICSNAGLRQKVEDYAVTILPAGGNDVDLDQRTFSCLLYTSPPEKTPGANRVMTRTPPGRMPSYPACTALFHGYSCLLYTSRCV